MQEIIDNLIELIIKSRKRKTVRGFLTDLKQALGIGGKSSDYKYFTVNGVKCSIRVSNHNAKASNYANRNSRVFNNTSIVIKSSRKSPNTFAPDNKVVIKEYVYFRPDLEGNSDMFPLIVEGIAELLQTGKYIDKTGIAKQNISPEEGNNLSGNKSNAFSCFDCTLLTMRNSMYYCQRWSCYTTKESIKFRKDYDLNTLCIPHSRLFENIITLAKLRTFSPLCGNDVFSQKNPIYNFVPSLKNAIFAGTWNENAYNEICRILKFIKDGTIRYERLREERFGGENGTDRIRRSVVLILGGSRSTSSTFRASREGLSSKFDRETRIVRAFAEYRNIWHNSAVEYVCQLGSSYHSKGNEARIFLSRDEKYVYKIKNVVAEKVQYGNIKPKDLLKFFDELTNYNILFPETKYEILGFGLDECNHFCTILKQKAIKGLPATPKQIEKYFSERGFKKYSNAAYYRNNFIISDLKPSNVVYSREKCYVIDCFAQNLFDFDNNFYINNILGNNLSGIIKPTYYDYDTEKDFNDYGKSRTATNGLLKDVKAFAKRLQNDLGLEDYYFRGKKRTISTNHTECNVHFVVPQAQAPNNHLHIKFYVDHPLRGINYDYTIEEWFPISLGPEHSFGDTCRFHIFDSYEEILRDIKIRYPIFRKPQTKQPENISPLFDYAIKLVKLKNGKTLSGTPENFIQKFQENIWKNGLNSVTLKQLDNVINDIQNGKYSLSYGQNIRENRGRIFLAAAVISGGGRETNRIIPTSYIQRSEWSERCGQLLEQWAKLEGCWIDNAENLKNIIVGILRKNGYIQNKDYRIKYYKSSPYWENRGRKNVQECWIYTKYGKAKVDTEDFDDMESLTDYVCGLIDMNWDGKKQRKKLTKQLFDTIIKLLKIRNKTTKKIHTK